MFAVRVRLVRSSLGPASTCIEDLRVRTGSAASCSARPQQSYRVRHRRLESWTSASRAQKVEDGTSSLFARKYTARKLEGLSFRAAIGDRQAVYRWLLGHELSFQAKSLADLGRGRRSIEPSLRSRTAAASLACSAPRVLHPSEEPHHRLAPAAVGLEEQHQQVRVRARRTDADGAWA